MYKRLLSLIIALFITINIAYAQGLEWIPDPNQGDLVLSFFVQFWTPRPGRCGLQPHRV